MRVIDADALLERLHRDPLFDIIESYGMSGVINAEPTVEAVPVIRCKDCKYWNEYSHRCDGIEGYWFAEEYCSRAELRTPPIRCEDCEYHGKRTNMCSIWHAHTKPEGYCHRGKIYGKGE